MSQLRAVHGATSACVSTRHYKSQRIERPGSSLRSASAMDERKRPREWLGTDIGREHVTSDGRLGPSKGAVLFKV